MKLTDKQFKVLEFLINKEKVYNTSVHGSMLTKIIYDDEVIKKYSFARKSKTVIDTMTFSYLGKMVKLGLIESEYQCNNNYSYYCGHYVTKKGLEIYKKNTL